MPSPHAADLLAQLGEPVILLDPVADRLLYCNAAAEKLLELPARKSAWIAPSRLFIPDLAKMIVFTQAVLHQQHGWTNDLQVLLENDEVKRLEMSASLVHQDDKQLLLCSLRDYERFEEMRQHQIANSLHREGLIRWKSIAALFSEFEQQNQLLLNAAGEGIYGVDTHGNTTFVNAAAERILGWRADELIGHNIHKKIHFKRSDGSTYPTHACHILAAFRDGEVRNIDDEVFWHKDGGLLAVEYTSTPIREKGRIIGAVVIFRDISERKRAEEQLRTALEEVQQLKQRLEMENAYLQEEYLSDHNYKEIVGRGAAIKQIIQKIKLVAPTNAAVLISGESGTGKELVARAIHESSDRYDRPMIRVNCASIPRELFESEFFGHIKGAFTGAHSDRSGRFELADGGTLFLDEVGEIPLDLQGKLLRVLQEQQFERVGESKTKRVDVRIIAATNRDLKQEVAARRFRQDLYFRLNVFPIDSVPLRQRIEDIPALASHFLKLASQKFGKPGIRLSMGNIEQLVAYPWPGNIRELINIIERAVILSTSDRLQLDLNIAAQASAQPPDEARESQRIYTEDEWQQQYANNLLAALNHCNGKVFGKGGAAELLNISPTTLSSRIRKFGIQKRGFICEENRPDNIATLGLQ